MKTAIAARVPVGSFFDLDRKDPVLTRLREEGAELALPFALMERLVKSGTPYAEHARSLRSEPVNVAGANFEWFDAELPSEIANEINLTDYEIVQHTDERRAVTSRMPRPISKKRCACGSPRGTPGWSSPRRPHSTGSSCCLATSPDQQQTSRHRAGGAVGGPHGSSPAPRPGRRPGGRGTSPTSGTLCAGSPHTSACTRATCVISRFPLS
ncbi:hypothetical protein [Kitasatospora sp. NPDC058190]|uniref:hypothetical protein n=1 Tax=Kitasatospora sp. NPDC058190 TaxID=3346371 RepID=UPI0036DF6422